jgi:hypothetical protein
VSDKQSLLSNFLKYYSSSTCGVNVTAINLAGNEKKNVGKKASNPRKRFKGPMPATDVVVNCQNVFGVGAFHSKPTQQAGQQSSAQYGTLAPVTSQQPIQTQVQASATSVDPSRPFSFLDFLHDDDLSFGMLNTFPQQHSFTRM